MRALLLSTVAAPTCEGGCGSCNTAAGYHIKLVNAVDSEPLFSIVMPTRNRPRDFVRALDSVLGQTCRDAEVIVVVDGSDDAARATYESIERASPTRVRFLYLMHRARGHGHCFARNHGIESACGTFIGFLDDDDYWTDTDFLNRAKAELERHGADAYFANQSAFEQDGREVTGLWLSSLSSQLPNSVRQGRTVYPVTVEQLLQARGFAHMNCWLVRKTQFVEAGGMDETLRYEPDLDIYMRVLDRGGTLLHDESIVSRHHVPDPTRKDNASTANGRVQKLLIQLTVADKHLITLRHPALLQRTRVRKGHILKRLAEALAESGELRCASHYARQGLVALPTAGWLLKTIWLSLRSIASPTALPRG